MFPKVFSYIDGVWVELDGNDEITLDMGLWINMVEDTELKIEGIEVENFAYNLNQGFNLVGYPSFGVKSPVYRELFFKQPFPKRDKINISAFYRFLSFVIISYYEKFFAF